MRQTIESEQKWDLTALTSIVKCEDMWQEYQECLEESMDVVMSIIPLTTFRKALATKL